MMPSWKISRLTPRLAGCEPPTSTWCAMLATIAEPPPADLDRRDDGDVVEVARAAMRVVDDDGIARPELVRPEFADRVRARSRSSRRDAAGCAKDCAMQRSCVSKNAQEKSARVLMLVENAARRMVTAISSVMLTSALRMTSKVTGSMAGRCDLGPGALPPSAHASALSRVRSTGTRPRSRRLPYGSTVTPCAGRDHGRGIHLLDDRRTREAVAGEQERRGRRVAQSIMPPASLEVDRPARLERTRGRRRRAFDQRAHGAAGRRGRSPMRRRLTNCVGSRSLAKP